MFYIRLYFNFLKNCFRRELMYRFNFIVGMFTVVLGYLSNILFYYFIYNTGVEKISGWNKYEVFILLATVWIVDSIFGGMFFFNLIKIPMKVKNYDLDAILLKPVNVIFILTLRQFNFGLFAGTFFGILFLIYSIYMGGFSIGIVYIIMYILLVFCAVSLLFSILFMMVTFSLRFVRIQGLIQVFWTLMDIGKQPYTIYPTAIKLCFIYLIPAIVIYNFPLMVLIDNNYLTIVMAFAISYIFMRIAVLNFKKSIKYYYN